MLKLIPLRKPRANKISTTVFHFSHKLNRQVWCESNLEWNVAILLDQDPSVIDYCEQSIKIPQKNRRMWTPDFVVKYKNGNIQVIEVKYSKEILDPSEKETYQRKFSEAEKWCEERGYEFFVVTEKTVQKDARVQNCRKLMEAQIDYEILLKLKPHLMAKTESDPGITIEQILNHMNDWNETLETTTYEVLTTLHVLLYSNLFEHTFEHKITNSTMLFLPNNSKIDRLETLETWLRNPNWLKIHPSTIEKIKIVDLHSIPKKHLDQAEKRFNIIKPQLDYATTNENVEKIAKENNIAKSTVWRWLKSYREKNDIRDLLPKYGNSGRKLFNPNSDMWEVGFNAYLKMEQPSVKQAYEIMQAKALSSNTKIPHYDTFRRRINKMDHEKVIKKRYGLRKSEKTFLQSLETFPHADWALQTVQIDHTPIDVRIVDEKYRLVVDRPFLTIALDVYSRAILGYTLTFDKPSRLSIAMTLLNCVESKLKSLKKVREVFPDLNEEELQIIETSSWKDVRGLPFTLHMDNGSDFVSKDIIRFGKIYQIHLHYRPVKGSQYGAHVERVLGTINKRLHILRGTTFSNITDKGDYKSDLRATWTINELEARLVTEIVRYHDEYHEGIKTTPSFRWQESFRNSYYLQTPNLNLPQEMDKFKMDILPSTERTVQNKGISLFNIYYNSQQLRKWIRAKDPLKSKLSRKFRIRYDPRDVRTIFFYDPENQEYLTIPTIEPLIRRLFSENPLSLWELKSANNQIIREGKKKEKTRQKLKIISLQQKMDKITKDHTILAKRKRTEDRKRREQQSNEYHQNLKETDQNNKQDRDIDWKEIKKRRKKRTIQIDSASTVFRKPNKMKKRMEGN